MYGKKELWVSLDRYGIMRPTKQVPVGKLPPCKTRVNVSDLPQDSTLDVKDFDHWKTTASWLHWDLNPWIWSGTNDGLQYSFDGNFIQENNGSPNDGNYKLQGLINFIDSSPQDGGFCCVPGFHKHLKDWANATKDSLYAERYATKYSFVHVPKADLLQQQVKLISIRAGSLLIWNSELPHANHPNHSQRFRMNQYIKFFPTPSEEKNEPSRRTSMEQYTKRTALSELNKKTLGLTKWEVD